MKVVKIIAISILGIFLIQICSFFSISDRKLVEQIGLNYETNLTFEKENEMEAGFVSEINLTEKQIQENFDKFKTRKVKTCKSQEECNDLRDSEVFYIYYFSNITRNPFWVNRIEEGEFAKFFGASWESKYIWLIYKWIFVGKEMTGIS